MNRTQQFKLNTISSLINQFCLVISGLILPRLILSNYGSNINGLVSSITQFLSIITFLDFGVGAVVQSALYKPLVTKDNHQLSLVLSSAKKYFRKIAYFLLIYIILLIIFLPLVFDNNVNFWSTAFLIFSMAISSFSQYYFGIVNEILLNADQKAYIQLFSETLVVILNIFLSTFLIIRGQPIQIVKFVSGIVFLLRPFYLNYFVEKNYDINFAVDVREEPIKQKWNGMAQHIAYTIQNSTDIIVLSLFSTLENVSIYAVYNMVVSGIMMIISSLTSSLKSLFGNMLANEEYKLLNTYFSKIEWLLNNLVIFLFGMTALLIDSFVLIYTSGIEDTNYNAPMFSIIFVIAKALYCLRTPYHALVLSAGHFKETQMSSIIEAGLNVIVSFLLINKLGLIGIAIGTLISMLYRTFYLAWYLSKNILNRPVNKFLKLFIFDILSFCFIVVLKNSIVFNPQSILEWIMRAVKFGVIYLVFLVLMNLLFYRKIMIDEIKNFYRKKTRGDSTNV